LIEISPHVQLTVNKRSPASISKTGRNRKALGVGKSIMSEAKNKSKVGMFTATIIALIIISIIFYFLKYFGVGDLMRLMVSLIILRLL
jgi:hypothetical protein